jgi:hypothetical protein
LLGGWLVQLKPLPGKYFHTTTQRKKPKSTEKPMSNRSRRRLNRSRRRVAMAAGALLAGAAIPIAAAGTAWADDTVTQTTPDKTETLTQLEHQGLLTNYAQAVVTAEGNGEAVEVSYNGKIVVDDNQGSTASTEATAKSATKDVAVAIGGGTDSTASGTGAIALTDGSNTGTTGGNSDTATAKGFGAEAIASDDTGTKVSATGTEAAAQAFASSNSTLTASGTYAYASDSSSTGDTLIAKGTGSEAFGGFNNTVTLTATGTAAFAVGLDSSNSSATATNTGPSSYVNADGYRGEAEVDYADGSKAIASGMGSYAQVDGTSYYNSHGVNISGSSAVDNNGTTTIVTASDINSTNGNVVHPEVTSLPVHVEVTPLTDVHVMPAMPLP